MIRIEHQEDLLTRMLEQQSAKIPSNLSLVSAFAVVCISLAAELRPRSSRFIGMGVGQLLTTGVYNKTFGAR